MKNYEDLLEVIDILSEEIEDCKNWGEFWYEEFEGYMYKQEDCLRNDVSYSFDGWDISAVIYLACEYDEDREPYARHGYVEELAARYTDPETGEVTQFSESDIRKAEKVYQEYVNSPY